MRRIMIVGQPGAGKSTFARAVGSIAHLPVFHMDLIHWQSGWVERRSEEKDALCAQVHAKERWVFEGGHSSTWSERLERADTLIWLDVAWPWRLWRIVKRTLRYYGRHRPDLPPGCPERFSPAFFGFVWRTRTSGHARLSALYDSTTSDKNKVHLMGPSAARRYLVALERAARLGNLGISHR